MKAALKGRRVRLRPPKPTMMRSLLAAYLALAGLGLILRGIAGISTSAAWIVGGLFALVAAVGYFRGSG